MGVRFVLGRAGAGKTHYCVNALLSALEWPEDTGRLILLVPEQASLQMERLLAGRCSRGGYVRAHVLSFSRLVQCIWSELGQPTGLLSSGARPMALRAVLGRPEVKLRCYRRAAQTAGFFTQLSRVIEELLLEDISWQQVQQAGAKLEDEDAEAGAKVGEIATIYRVYCESFCRQRLDPALPLAQVRSRLAEAGWLAGARIWVDGFSSFTGQELATLVALARLAAEMTITLLLDPAAPAVRFPNHPPDPLDVFYVAQRTYQALVHRLSAAGIPIEPPIILHPDPLPRFAASGQLARLEAGLAALSSAAETPSASQASAGQILILECPSHEAELRQAAHFIRRKIAESSGRLRFRDFALITRDLESFAPLVAEIFDEYEIPCFLDRRRPMRSHPLSRLIDALFEVVSSDFSTGATARLLRTGLLPLTRHQCELLENLVIGHGVHGFSAWCQSGWDFSADELRGVGRLSPKVEKARLLLADALRPLVGLAGAVAPPTGACWAETLYRVLRNLRVERRVEKWIRIARCRRDWERAEIHRLGWQALCEVLNDLHELLHDTPLTVHAAATVLDDSLSQRTLGLAPPTLDQVLVSSIERSRHPDIQYAWVFAFNAGLFPPAPPHDILLTTRERQSLVAAGLPQLSSRQDLAWHERFLAYVALTRASAGLVISYAAVGLDGSPLLPSPLLDEVRRAVPEVVPARPDPWAPVVCVREFARDFLQANSKAPETFATRFLPLYECIRSDPQAGVLLDHLLRGRRYRSGPEKVTNYRRPARPELLWSGTPSELEIWLDCSWKHFAAKGLKLSAERRPRPHSWSLGTYAHELLARTTFRAAQYPGGVRALSDDQWKELTTQVLKECEQGLPADLRQRRPDLALLIELLGNFVRELVLAQAYRWRRGCFEPISCEQPFGLIAARPGAPHAEAPAAWPSLLLTDKQGNRFVLCGKIDRIDRAQIGDQSWLVVYDYKTTLPGPLPRYLTGAWFQVLLYVLALQASNEVAEKATIGGGFLIPLYPNYRALASSYVCEASPEEQQMYLYRPRGVFLPQIARELDQELGTRPSPVAYVRLRADGQFNRANSRDALDPELLARYLELARATAVLAAAGIAEGTIEAAPLVENHRLACRRCDFGPVCRFDRTLNRVRPAEASLPTIGRATPNRSHQP